MYKNIQAAIILLCSGTTHKHVTFLTLEILNVYVQEKSLKSQTLTTPLLSHVTIHGLICGQFTLTSGFSCPLSDKLGFSIKGFHTITSKSNPQLTKIFYFSAYAKSLTAF